MPGGPQPAEGQFRHRIGASHLQGFPLAAIFMAPTEPLDTHHKALTLNLARTIYGSFAEIGAGQEVARWFLRVGGASGTVAKAISAYDMAVSDALYGPTDRYVSRRRLEAMRERESATLVEQLGAHRG